MRLLIHQQLPLLTASARHTCRSLPLEPIASLGNALKTTPRSSLGGTSTEQISAPSTSRTTTDHPEYFASGSYCKWIASTPAYSRASAGEKVKRLNKIKETGDNEGC